MKSLLFVDDEPEVLAGLRGRLRRKRKQWEAVFAEGANAALSELGTRPFDAIITDMRMPQMDGAELLARVREQYPRTLRVMLTGQVQLGASMRSASVAQRSFHKPCDIDEMLGTISELLTLNDELANPRLLEVLGRVDNLPSEPRLFMHLQSLLEDPSTTMDDVAELVGKDVATSAQILQIANSGFLTLARPLCSVAEAIRYLGIDAVRALALAASVFEKSKDVLPGLGSVSELNRHSFMVATLASKIAPEGLSFAGGLLHDLGALLLAQAAPEECERIAAEMVSSGRCRVELEREYIGVGHPELGAHQLALWGLPLELVEMVAHHHDVQGLDVSSIASKDAVLISQALLGGTDERDRLQGAYGEEQWQELVALAEQVREQCEEVQVEH